MKKYLAALAIFTILLPFQVLAQDASTTFNKIKNPTETVLKNSGLSNMTLGLAISSIIKVALSLLAIIFLVLLIIAGYRWMTANGNESQVEKSVSTIKMAIIGLAIVLMAYAVTYFVFDQLPFSSSDNGQPTAITS